jgi:hypothetical protein
MSELDPTKMSEEDLKVFMSSSPTREEVNKYMNNLFTAVNNSVGVFQGYLVTAMASTNVEYLQELGSKVTIEEFLNRFTENNMKVIKEAQEQMKAVQAKIDSGELKMKTDADTDEDASSDREVDVSVF